MMITYSREQLHELLGEPSFSRIAAVHEPGGAVRFSVREGSLEPGLGRPVHELRFACGCRAVQEAPGDEQFILYPCAPHASSGTFERLHDRGVDAADAASNARLADL